jgi:type IV secretory pathway VirB10-like protein
MNPSNRRVILLIGLVILFAIGLLVLKRGQRAPEPESPQQPQLTQADTPTPQTTAAPAAPAAPPQPAPQRQETRQAPPPQQDSPQVQVQPEDLPQQTDAHTRIHDDVRGISDQLNEYRNRNGSLPATLGAAGVIAKDPWQRDYIYQFPSTRGRESYDLFSAGPDGMADTPDDDWGETGTEENPPEQ